MIMQEIMGNEIGLIGVIKKRDRRVLRLCDVSVMFNFRI